MSRTIKAIERHMIPRSSRLRSEPDWHKATARQAKQPMQNAERKLVGEWQQRGPETLSGRMLRKLRLAFAPSQSTKLATVNR